jgi:hypothetical protein
VVEPDAPVLGRAAPFLLLGAAVVTWDAVAPHVALVGVWSEVAIIAGAVLPATLGLIFVALPLWSRTRAVATAGVVVGLVALGTWEAGWHLASNFAKLAAYACAGWVFLRFFEELGWVVIVAAIIPFVDALSVAAGPTRSIVNHHPAVYSAVAVAFVGPAGVTADLGPPDILFYALFLAAAVRWRLRPGWTWLAMTAMYSLTLVVANAADVNGLPALPFLSVGFLLANADLLWRRLRRRA